MIAPANRREVIRERTLAGLASARRRGQLNLYHYKPQPRDYRQSPTAQQPLQTRLQATVDALALRGESLADFAIGFVDEFAPQLHHNRARL